MKILVTGGAGFIGSHVADRLIERKHKVVVVDNLSTGTLKNLNPKATFHKADLVNFKKIQEIFKKEKPEIVFHLAAQIDVRKSVADPIFDAKSNILASINLIKTAQESKVKKFIFSSTGGATYGDTESRPTPEDHPEWPLSPYGIAKMTIDKYLNYFHKVHGLKYVSLRYGNVYGPRQNPHGEAGVVAIFLNKMLSGLQPVINGNGKQTRDYVYVDDVASANLLALKHLSKIGIYNVGTAKETSVDELFDEINRHFSNKFKQKHGPAKLGEQMTSCLKYSKINRELRWQPKTNFPKGIEKTYQWFLMQTGSKGN